MPGEDIKLFRVEPSQIEKGKSAKLLWSVVGNARTIEIQTIDPVSSDDVDGRRVAISLPRNGQLSVSPQATTRYRLKATFDAGSTSAYDELEVVPPFQTQESVKNGDNLSTDKLLAFIFGVFFALLLLVIARWDRDPTPMAILIYRVVLALVAAGIGAVIPGMIDINVQHCCPRQQNAAS